MRCAYFFSNFINLHFYGAWCARCESLFLESLWVYANKDNDFLFFFSTHRSWCWNTVCWLFWMIFKFWDAIFFGEIPLWLVPHYAFWSVISYQFIEQTFSNKYTPHNTERHNNFFNYPINSCICYMLQSHRPHNNRRKNHILSLFSIKLH